MRDFVALISSILVRILSGHGHSHIIVIDYHSIVAAAPILQPEQLLSLQTQRNSEPSSQLLPI